MSPPSCKKSTSPLSNQQLPLSLSKKKFILQLHHFHHSLLSIHHLKNGALSNYPYHLLSIFLSLTTAAPAQTGTKRNDETYVIEVHPLPLPQLTAKLHANKIPGNARQKAVVHNLFASPKHPRQVGIFRYL